MRGAVSNDRPYRDHGVCIARSIACRTAANNLSSGPILCEIIDLSSSGGKRIFDRDLNMLVPSILRWLVVDYDVFVRRNCKPNVDIEAGAVMVLVTRCDNSYAATDDMMIVFLQSFYLTFDRRSHGVRRLGPFKSHLNWNLHSDLSSSTNIKTPLFHTCLRNTGP